MYAALLQTSSVKHGFLVVLMLQNAVIGSWQYQLLTPQNVPPHGMVWLVGMRRQQVIKSARVVLLTSKVLFLLVITFSSHFYYHCHFFQSYLSTTLV
jgi:hypothetical protein